MLATASQIMQLTAALAAGWGLIVVPAYLIAGPAAVEGTAYAALLCLLPGVLLHLRESLVGIPSQPFAALVLGMGFRLAVVLIGALVIRVNRPELGGATFLIWLVPLYCLALAVETRQAVCSEPSTRNPNVSVHGPAQESLT